MSFKTNMIISAISTFNIHTNNYYTKPKQQPVRQNYLRDSFVRSNNIISFGNKYDQIFPAIFFNKLMHEGIPCAYTGVKLIPKEDFKVLKGLGEMVMPLNLSIDYLKGYETYLYSFEQKILKIISNEHKKTHKLNILQIFKKRFGKSEKDLRKKQLEALNKILLESRDLPPKQFEKLRVVIINIMVSLTEQKPKGMILDPAKIVRSVKKLSITDKQKEKNLLKLAEKIPTEKNSTDAYIMMKARNNYAKSDRQSHDIAINLLEQTVGSNEHFWPQELYKTEEKGVPKFRFTLLTSHYVNQLKGNMQPDDFIKKYRKFKTKANIQAQVDRLIEIYDKWQKTDTPNARRLLDYILTYKHETEKRSKLVKINIDEFINNLNSTPKGQEELKNAQKRIKKYLNM